MNFWIFDWDECLVLLVEVAEGWVGVAVIRKNIVLWVMLLEEMEMVLEDMEKMMRLVHDENKLNDEVDGGDDDDDSYV